MKDSTMKWNLQFFGEGVEEQEVADPVEPENNDSDMEVKGAEVQESADPVENHSDDDARYAAIRRKAEEDARKRYEGRAANLNNQVQHLFKGAVNPATGQPIQTAEDYFQAVQAQQQLEREQELRSKGIDPSVIEQMVNNSPAMIQAQRVIEKSNIEEANRRFEDDFKTLQQIDPAIQTKEDLAAHPSYPTVVKYVTSGLSLPDAYKLANFDTLTSQKSEAAKQSAINAAKSQQHLQSTATGAGGSDNLVEIPADEIGVWKEYYPNLSDTELKKKYNETL